MTRLGDRLKAWEEGSPLGRRLTGGFLIAAGVVALSWALLDPSGWFESGRPRAVFAVLFAPVAIVWGWRLIRTPPPPPG